MEKKIGVYICSGCGIGDALDMEALVKLTTDEHKADSCRQHDFLCGQEGLKIIKEDMEKDGVNTVVIGACSPRVNTEGFSFPQDKICERVNLREHVAWCQKPNDEDTQLMAEDYLTMGIVRAQKTELLEPYLPENISSKIMVVGGGLSGITAALEASKAGYEVLLVEKEKELGGWAAGQYMQLPSEHPYAQLAEPDIAGKIRELENSSAVEVMTEAQVKEISGQPGCFDVTILGGEGEAKQRIGSIIQTTGASEYDLTKVERLGLGKYPNVISSGDLEAMAVQGDVVRPSDGKKAESVLFIQCAGSRDKNHLAYCSAECCLNSLKQAQYIRSQDAGAKAYIIYKDMRTPGHYENYYKAVQEDPGIFLSKGEIKDIKEEDKNKLIVTVENTLMGEDIEIEVDLVVLA
ncbi:CoB--CoM heterodisulfide reductase iron-sulfur subunit A family protein, partial [Fibrobacterota bacterium]